MMTQWMKPHMACEATTAKHMMRVINGCWPHSEQFVNMCLWFTTRPSRHHQKNLSNHHQMHVRMWDRFNWSNSRHFVLRYFKQSKSHLILFWEKIIEKNKNESTIAGKTAKRCRLIKPPKTNQRWCKLIFINLHLPNSQVVLIKIYVAQIIVGLIKLIS